jgi:hypothetical protein
MYITDLPFAEQLAATAAAATTTWATSNPSTRRVLTTAASDPLITDNTDTVSGRFMLDLHKLRLSSFNANSCGANHRSNASRLYKRLEIQAAAGHTDILFVQETHGYDVPLPAGWIVVANSYVSGVIKPNGHCRGVAIAVRASILHDDPDVQLLWSVPARGLAVSVHLLSGLRLNLAVLYFPNHPTEQCTFMDRLDWHIIGKCVWGADSNITTRRGDRGPSALRGDEFTPTAASNLFVGNLRQHRMCDAWTLAFPIDAAETETERPGFLPHTHHSSGVGRANCIDRIVMPNTLARFFESIETAAATSSDHDFVNLLLSNNENMSNRPIRQPAVQADWLTKDDWDIIRVAINGLDGSIGRARDKYDSLIHTTRLVFDARRAQLRCDDITDAQNFEHHVRRLQARIRRVDRRSRRLGVICLHDDKLIRRAQVGIKAAVARRLGFEVAAEKRFDQRTHVDVKQLWRRHRNQSARHAQTPRIGTAIDEWGRSASDDGTIETVFVDHFRRSGHPMRSR